MVQSRNHLEDEASSAVRAFSLPASPGVRPRPGRPRDTRVHEAILDTTRTLLGEIGYSRLTIEGVASRAGVGKGTIYRHWPSKGHLVAESISAPLCPIETGVWTVRLGTLPDSGSLRGDLLTFVQRVNFAFTAPLAGETLPGLAMDLSRDDELAETFRSYVVEPKRERISEVLERAQERGELKGDVDVALLCDMLVGPLLYRALLTRQEVDQAAVEELVDRVMQSLPLAP
jgi:AcrR family transcriptional regulator